MHLAAEKLRLSNSQLEGLVELCRPAVVLGLRGELALLVGQLRADHADFDEGPEHPRCLPLHVVHCNDCTQGGRRAEVQQRTGRRHVTFDALIVDHVIGFYGLNPLESLCFGHWCGKIKYTN